MKPKEIQELIDFISNSGLAEVKIETDEFKLSIKKNAEPSVSHASHPAPAAAAPSPQAPTPQGNPTPAAPAPSEEKAAQSSEDTSSYVEVKSPMIGTFYLTPNPDSDPFVNIGDTIKAGQTVCIIEAMKLFNEIESEVSGKIVKILVENSTPVEYDQPLFLVDPAG